MARLLLGEPVGRAMDRAEQVLFKPLVRKKWLVMGVAAWLANVNEWRGMGAAMELLPHGIAKFLAQPEEALKYLEEHRGGLLLGLVGLTVVLFGVYLLFRWLNCRGQFMLLEAVVSGELKVKESWRRHRGLGNSLMKFRIGWDLLIFNIFLVLLVGVGLLLWPDFRPMLSGIDYQATGWTWSAVIFGGVGLMGALVFIGLATLFLDYFVVPVMFLRDMQARPAFWHALKKMFWPNRKAGVLFLLMMMLTEMLHGMAMSAAMMAVVLGTCLVGGALMLVPLVSLLPVYPMATLALPVDFYSRAYCLYFLEQFGEEYRAQWREGAGLG